MPSPTAPTFPSFLTLGHVLASLGAEHHPRIGLDDVLVIRHSFAWPLARRPSSTGSCTSPRPPPVEPADLRIGRRERGRRH